MRGHYVLSIIFALAPSAITRTNGPDAASISAVYYEPSSGLPMRMEAIQNGLVSGEQSTKSTLVRRIGFRSNGCSCQELVCGCCTGINIQQLNFNREGCMNFTYDPFDFSISMDVFMNDNRLFSNTVSAKNPPPLCVPVPVPYLPTVDFCLRLFDIFTPAQNLHMCLDFETRIQSAPILVLHFDCMRMGNNGIALVKPGDPGIPLSPAVTDTPVTDVDGYDEVTEIKYKQRAYRSRRTAARRINKPINQQGAK